jgi:2-polyprenyl-6-methoxyphenol hydroxylase-like FAD-dependent oxidoreductase
MNTTFAPVLVVGGGIGGLAAALSVARHGRPVRVLERADEFAEIGAGLQFGPNASRALAALGVFDDIRPLAVAPRRGVMRDAVGGGVLTELDLGPGFQDRYGYPYLVLHRGDLLDALVARCRADDLITLEAGRNVTGAQVRADGATVTCADGQVYETEALIAADGLHSRLRSEIIDDTAVCSGFAAYRGTVPMSEAPGTVTADEVTLWVGPGIHVIQYPVRGGEVCNQVAVFRSERYHAGHTGPGEWGTAEELDRAFANTCVPVRAAVARIGRDRYWPMYDRSPVASWFSGRLLLTGDAAHPMLQYLGQGACQALEDAVELGYRLELHGSDIGAAYREFQEARLPRTARCQTVARPWGDLWHTGDPLTVALRNRLLAKREPDDYTEVDWLYAAAQPGTAAPGLTASPRPASAIVP